MGESGWWVVLTSVGPTTMGGVVIGDERIILETTLGGLSRKVYEGGEVGVIEPKGKTFSSNLTCIEIMNLFVFKSRQRYPRWL